MLSVIRRAVAVASLLVVSSSAAQAQVELREVRIDFASLTTLDGSTVISLGGPSRRIGGFLSAPASVALGVYLNDKLALEPSLSLTTIQPDNRDLTLFIGLGLWAPYYFDSGRSGLFVAPGLELLHVTEEDLMLDVGADFGFKTAVNDNLSWRIAAGFRTGDMTANKLALNATVGFSWFLK